MLLALEPLWRDHDGMLEFRFSSTARLAAEIISTTIAEAMETFGRTLREFPRPSADEVVLRTARMLEFI